MSTPSPSTTSSATSATSDLQAESTSEWSPLFSTAAFAAAQGLIVYSLFECWRRQQNKRGIYQPRQTQRPHRTPEEPSPAPFSWLSAIGSVDDDALLRMVGMDHYVLLRHCLLGFKLTCIPSIIGVVLMVLVYRTGGNGEEKYNELTMANVEQESVRLWYSLGFMYIIVIWALILWWAEWKNFVPRRRVGNG